MPWSNLTGLWKPEACGQTLLPDRSVVIGQKLVGNAKIQKIKSDILSHFPTLCINLYLSLFDILQTLLNFEKDSNGIWSGAKTCQLFCLAKNWIVDIEVTFHVARKQNSLFYSWLKLLFQKMHEQTDTTYQFLSDLFWQTQQNQLKILFVL